jgi:hypothetical protein
MVPSPHCRYLCQPLPCKLVPPQPHTSQDATEKIAELEAWLEQASEREEDLKLEIANLHDELAAAFVTLHTQEATLAAHDNHRSMSTSSKPTSPTPSRASPFPLLPINLTSSGKARALPAAFLSPLKSLSFPKLEPLKLPRNVPGPSGASLNLSPTSPSVGRTSGAPRTVSKPKLATGITILGPATKKFIKVNDLTQIVHMLVLIIQNKPASQWGKLLSTISLPDRVHDLLLEVMSEDRIAEEITEVGSESSDEDYISRQE